MTRPLSAVAALAVPSLALAHPGHGVSTSGLAEGVFHPVSGSDHLLAMVAVGLLASQISHREGADLRTKVALPATFVGAMAAGAAMAAGGVALPGVEACTLMSVVALGAAVAFGGRVGTAALATLCGVAGLFHGQAHGLEAGASAGFAFFAGMLLSTAGLHAAGVGLAGLARRTHAERADAAVRLAGGAIACSVLLMA